MKKRVLVVDDDRSVRESLSKVLREEHYEVVQAADGQEALEQFEKQPVDLLMLDLGLPIRHGWGVFERITSENPLLPIIVITGQINQYPVAVAAGVGALMEKPLDVPRLLQTVNDLLAKPPKARLLRICGHTQNMHHIPCDSAMFLKRLRERYTAPLRTQLYHAVNEPRGE